MSKEPPAGTRILGSLRADVESGAVRVEDRYPTDIEDLWSALTEPERIARWIADVDGELRPGGRFRISFTSGWAGVGRVEECERPRRLLLTLAPGAADETVIEAALTAHGEQTHLVVEERGLPVGELPEHGAGWQAHLEDLAALVAGREPEDWRGRWTELTPIYRDLA